MRSRPIALIITFLMLFSMLPATVLAMDPSQENSDISTFTDISGHWAEEKISQWADYGVINGADGHFRPNDPISRGELAAVLNRTAGYTAVTNTAFLDTPSDAWYYGDMARLYAANIMQGDGSGNMRPKAFITREETSAMIARAFNITEKPDGAALFPDQENISSWAYAAVGGMKDAGYISGDSNGNFNAKSNISRAEVVTILDNMIGQFYGEPETSGDSTLSSTANNVVIRSDDVTLKNCTITNDLYIMEGVGHGDVTLENVKVSGTTYIRGGGSSSIHVIGGNLGTVVMSGQTGAHLDMSKSTSVSRILLNTTGSVTHDKTNLKYDSDTDTLTLGGAMDRVTLNTDGTATVNIAGAVYDFIPTTGDISNMMLPKDTVIGNMILNAALEITGTGTIKNMDVHSDGVAISSGVNLDLANLSLDEGKHLFTGDGKGTTYIGDSNSNPIKSVNTNNSNSGSSSSGSKGSSAKAITVTSYSAINGTQIDIKMPEISGIQFALTGNGYSGTVSSGAYGAVNAGTYRLIPSPAIDSNKDYALSISAPGYTTKNITLRWKIPVAVTLDLTRTPAGTIAPSILAYYSTDDAEAAKSGARYANSPIQVDVGDTLYIYVVASYSPGGASPTALFTANASYAAIATDVTGGKNLVVASSDYTQVVNRAAPTVSIDYMAEKIIGYTDSMEYSISGSGIFSSTDLSKNLSLNDLIGKDILIRLKEIKDTGIIIENASDNAHLTLPPRPTTPNAGLSGDSTFNAKIIIGLSPNSTYEWLLSNALSTPTNWSAKTESTTNDNGEITIDNSNPNTYLHIRIPATDASFASEVSSIGLSFT